MDEEQYSEIDCYSEPILDEIDFWGLFGSEDYWNCAQWVKFHKELVKCFGKEQADLIFEEKWTEQNWFHAWPYSFCKYDSAFVTYFKNNSELDVGHIISDAVVVADEVVSDVLETLPEISEGIKRTGSTLKYVLPVVLIGGALYLAWPYLSGAKKLRK